MGNSERGSVILTNVLQRLENFYIPEEIRKIHERNSNLWTPKNINTFQKDLDQWIREIIHGNLESQGLERIRGNVDSPNVTIVIPAHNEEKYILQILASIAAQNYDQGIEVILVDNNSSLQDRTFEIAEKCGAKVIKYNLTEENPNLQLSQIAFARQKGLLEAKGKIIISTDADAITPNGWVQSMINPLMTNKKISCVTGHVAHYDKPENPQSFGVDIVRATAGKIITGYFNLSDPKHTKIITGAIPGANFAFRKEDASKVGGYETNVYPGEDTALALKLRQLGKIKLNNDKDAIVRVSPRRYTGLTILETMRKGLRVKSLYSGTKGEPIIRR